MVFTLKQLVEHVTWMLTDQNENNTVKIQIRVAGSIGSTPTVDIKNITAGFDWDSGKIIITPTVELQEFDPPAHKKIMEMYDKVGLTQIENRHLKRENAKLKEMLGVKE